MLRKCHGHGLTKGVIIQIFYHGLDEPTQAILDVTAGGIFLYKSPNQAFQLLEDKVLFEHDWAIKSKNEHHQKSVSFADGSDSNTDNSRFVEKLKAMDSKVISLNEELQDMREKYNELRNGNASKNHLNDYTPMCERHEVNFIQSEELNNDVRNDLEDFKRLSNMFVKNNVKDMILKMKQNEKNFQTIFKNMEIKINEWEKSQNISLEQTYKTEPQPPPQAQTEHVNGVFTGSVRGCEPKQIILDPDDQPMWESAKTVAPTPNSAIIQLDVDDNFVINSTHLKMIWENKFNGYLRADPHDHISKTWFKELNEESITSWEQMRKAFINKFFPPLLFNRLLLEIRNFSQLVCESLTDAWLRLKSMLQKCHGHGLTKGAIIHIFYHGLDEPTQGILDVTAGGIFLYKSPNQAFQFLEDKVLFEHDWPIKSKNKHHRRSISFADRSDSNTDNSRFMEKLKAVDSHIISLNEELQDIRNKYNELREENASKNNMNDDMLMRERHEANYIQSEGYQNRKSHNSFFHQSLHYPNDPEKSLAELNNDVKNKLEDFKRHIRSMRTVHWKLFARDDGKTSGVLPNKESKPINQEPQFKTDFKKLMTKLLDDQRVSNMFAKNNINDMILKMKQNEKNFQAILKNMEK
ncbi:reverse transcriptase domain-containing protein [Tanacetum coccineum]